MTERTPLWVANYGEVNQEGVVGIDFDIISNVVVVRTENVDFIKEVNNEQV